ncbi:hypothetical protein Bbelb_297970 [Branchiostoma belcheri]|nr:hypothetical protein Bbelb_297970 [Branchiostoma belcheri]
MAFSTKIRNFDCAWMAFSTKDRNVWLCVDGVQHQGQEHWEVPIGPCERTKSKMAAEHEAGGTSGKISSLEDDKRCPEGRLCLWIFTCLHQVIPVMSGEGTQSDEEVDAGFLPMLLEGLPMFLSILWDLSAILCSCLSRGYCDPVHIRGGPAYIPKGPVTLSMSSRKTCDECSVKMRCRPGFSLDEASKVFGSDSCCWIPALFLEDLASKVADWSRWTNYLDCWSWSSKRHEAQNSKDTGFAFLSKIPGGSACVSEGPVTYLRDKRTSDFDCEFEII